MRLTLAIQKVGDRVAELGDAENTPWSGRSPATVASAIILGMRMLEQVGRGGRDGCKLGGNALWLCSEAF